MPLTIFRLTEADVPAYRALMLRAYDVPDAFTSTPQERAASPARFWLERVAHPNGLSVAFGAFDGRELAGTVTLEFNHRANGHPNPTRFQGQGPHVEAAA
jgi:hypothetical protein